MNRIVIIAMHFVLLLNSIIGASEEEIQLPIRGSGSLRGSDKYNREYHGMKNLWKFTKEKDLSMIHMKNLRRKLMEEGQHEDLEIPDDEGDYDYMDMVDTIDETLFGEEMDQNEDDAYYKVDDDNFDCDDALDHQEYYEFIEEKLENKKDPSRTQQEDTI